MVIDRYSPVSPTADTARTALERSRQDIAPARPVGPPTDPGARTSVTVAQVLIIEDNVQMAELLQAALSQPDQECHLLDDGSEALAWTREQRFDLILLDLGLPGMDGTEVLRQLKQDPHSAHIPVIVMTGRQSMEDKLQAFELGAADYLTKPFALVELRARVSVLLRNKRLQDELAAANQNLRAKAELLAKASHEIRTQLGAVTAMAGLLCDTHLDTTQREYAETIRTSGDSLLVLLNDILSLSRLESGKMELDERPFHLRLCLDEAMDLLAVKAAEKQLDLLCEIEPGVPEEVIGDSARLRQVLVNLISNAVKFTERGEVEVRVQARQRAGWRTPSTPDADRLEYYFSVRDTGIGIAPAQLPRLFQSFSQADASISRDYGGSGLGLFICRGLVELMGGRIWAQSREGAGSTFCFTLPLRAGPTQALAAWQEAQPLLAGRRVLIMDDNAASARFLERVTRRWQMEASVTADPVTALAMVRGTPRVDLVILDLGMSLPDPADYCRSLKTARAGGVPLVLCAPLDRHPLGSELQKAGLGLVAHKPIKPARLHAAVLRSLGFESRLEASPAAPATRPHRLDGTLASRVPLAILLVDDNPINRKIGLKMLARLGYEAEAAEDGQSAVAAASKRPFDLILMDIQMPGMNGLEASMNIRGMERRTGQRPARIVAVTANALPGDREKCLAWGMDDHIAKPLQARQLQELIESLRPAEAPAQPVAEPAPAQEFMARDEGSPRFDASRLRDFAGGSAESLAEIVALYQHQTADQLETIESALGTGQTVAAGRAAHTCAGASSVCGADSMATLMRQLEAACESGDTARARELVRQARAEFAAVQQRLRGEIEHVGVL